MSEVAVILVAAGDGSRLGAGTPKALVKVGGRSILELALINILKVKGLSQIIVAAHENHLQDFQDIAASVISDRVSFRSTPGGNSRQGSIANALLALEGSPDVVLVHDAARCFTPPEVFERVIDAVIATEGGVIPVLPVTDTIKQVDFDRVLGTISRDDLRIAQTPQGFPTKIITQAYAQAVEEYTDDASLIQATGSTISLVQGDSRGFKITTPADLAYAELLSSSSEQRTGIGTDVHRFASTPTPLYLGTLLWPDEVGLEGHSDGDCVAHAIVDALLAAAGLGDIGTNFGVDRPEFAGARGSVFILETLKLLAAEGWTVSNVSVQLIGNKPKLAPRRVEMQEALSALIGAPCSVGATTTDGLGFLGSSEGIGAVATALIEKPRARL